jgi:hypothetical protein
MADETRSRKELRNNFDANAIPGESDFAGLIEGTLNRRDDRIFKDQGKPLAIVAETETPQGVIDFYGSPEDAKPSWSLSLKSCDGKATGLTISDGGNNSWLFIDASTGNLGLGTTEPAAKLDVNGKAYVEGDLQITGGLICGSSPFERQMVNRIVLWGQAGDEPLDLNSLSQQTHGKRLRLDPSVGYSPQLYGPKRCLRFYAIIRNYQPGVLINLVLSTVYSPNVEFKLDEPEDQKVEGFCYERFSDWIEFDFTDNKSYWDVEWNFRYSESNTGKTSRTLLYLELQLWDIFTHKQTSV